MDRLNIQAHKNALTSTDEFVMDSFVTYEKVLSYIINCCQVGLLIYDLLVAETWKQKVLPLMMKDLGKISSIRSYLTVSYLV